MNEDRRQILEMLANGQISTDEAERLLAALGQATASGHGTDESKSASDPDFFRVVIDAEDEKEGPVKVNVRIPIKLIRAGVRLTSVIPQSARGHLDAAMDEHGVDFDLSKINPENVDEIIQQLREFTVDVDSNNAKVRVYCE